MTPKEKAKELVDKFTLVGLQQRNEGIQCAIIAVKEILSMGIMSHSGDWEMAKSYWEEVKTEIQKL
jgi:hypothetical protein